MSSSVLPCRRPEIAWRVIDGEAIVVNPRASLAFPFNPVATRFWELADGQRTLSEITALLAEEFDAPADQIERDMRLFADELSSKQLIDLKAGQST